MEPGQGSAWLPLSSWEPSPGHWEHSPAPGQAGGWWHLWFSGDSPNLQVTPGPLQPVLSQAWSSIPAKVLMDAGHLGHLQSLHPSANTGPSHQLKVSLKCFFLSFLHGVPKLNLTLTESISPLFPGPGGHKAQGRFLSSLPCVTTGSNCNTALYPAQWHPLLKVSCCIVLLSHPQASLDATAATAGQSLFSSQLGHKGYHPGTATTAEGLLTLLPRVSLVSGWKVALVTHTAAGTAAVMSA